MISEEKLEKKLFNIFSVDQIFSSSINIPARFFVLPKEPEQIKELVTLSKQDGITLFAIGGGTRLYTSNLSFDVAVAFSKLDGKIEHSPADLTATVPAGFTFIETQKTLEKHAQTIPLNPYVKISSTIGGVVSTNAFGPHRHRFGTARDWVIATTLINDRGNMVKNGAKVLKNVSGYDLNKLYIGSRGTLGFIIDISFQLYPIPEGRETFQAQFDRFDKAFEVSEVIRKAPLQVDSIILVNGKWNPGNESNWTLIGELSGSRKSLKAQVRNLESYLGQPFSLFNSTFKSDTSDYILLRFSLGKKNMQLFFKSALSDLHFPISIKAFPGVGTGYIHFPDTLKQVETTVKVIIQKIKSLGGYVEFEMLPSDSPFKRWPILPSSFPWMKKIKKALDPDGIFAPGSFIGGI